MKLLPRSLFGRALLVLAAGLVLAEVASQTMNFFDRGSGVYRLGAQVTARRIAVSARILNRLAPEQRKAVIEEMNGPSFSVVLSSGRVEVGQGFAEHNRYEQSLANVIRHHLHAGWAGSGDRPPTTRPTRAPWSGGSRATSISSCRAPTRWCRRSGSRTAPWRCSTPGFRRNR
jgi:hypothetical protein